MPTKTNSSVRMFECVACARRGPRGGCQVSLRGGAVALPDLNTNYENILCCGNHPETAFRFICFRVEQIMRVYTTLVGNRQISKRNIVLLLTEAQMLQYLFLFEKSFFHHSQIFFLCIQNSHFFQQ